jgi:STE24 endopeptidase
MDQQDTRTRTPPEPPRPADPDEAQRYERQKLAAGIAGLGVGVAYVAVMAVWGGAWLDRLVEPWSFGSRWLRLYEFAVLFAAGAELLTLPIDFWSSYVLEHRYGLSNQSLAGWVAKRLKGYLVGGALGAVLLFGLYALVWWAGDWWWIGATVGWLVLTLVLGQLLPMLILPLFYKVTRLDDPALADRLRRLAAGTGLTVEGVYRIHLSAETRKANAALAGLGRTRRVLLGDTLLENFTPDEIEVVFAHEVGHHVHRHLPKLIVLSVICSAAGFWLCDGVLRLWLGPTGIQEVRSLPALVLVLTLFGLLLGPLQNALSRFFERQCDRYALARTGNVPAYRSAFEKLARLNKSSPDPSRLVVWLFYDHPPIRDRLAMADADEGRRSG